MELFDLNSNLNNLFESSSTKDFSVDSSVNVLVDLVMQFCILPNSIRILKFSLAGYINNNKFTTTFIFYCFFFFLFRSQYPCYYFLVHQRLLLIYTWENMHQFYSLKPYVAVLFLHLQIMSQFLTILITLDSLLYHAG